MSTGIEGQDVFIALTKAGKTHINHHRVWDRDRFFASQVDQYSGPMTKPNDVHQVRLANRKENVTNHKGN